MCAQQPLIINRVDGGAWRSRCARRRAGGCSRCSTWRSHGRRRMLQYRCYKYMRNEEQKVKEITQRHYVSSKHKIDTLNDVGRAPEKSKLRCNVRNWQYNRNKRSKELHKPLSSQYRLAVQNTPRRSDFLGSPNCPSYAVKENDRQCQSAAFGSAQSTIRCTFCALFCFARMT